MTMIISPTYVSLTTILGGSISFSIKIPGTYGGINPNDPTTGRYFQEALIWADAPSDGDLIHSLKLTDTDGVVTMPERAFLPNYPDIVRFYEPSIPTGADGTGVLLCAVAGGTKIRPFESNAESSLRFMPSQLYLTGTVRSGALALGKTFRIQIIWGRWV